MNNDWKQDPKLQNISPDKLKYLTEFAQKIEKTPKDQLLSSFMMLNMDIQNKGIQFSDQETEMLVSIMTKNMSPADRKKLDTLRMLSKKLAKQK